MFKCVQATGSLMCTVFWLKLLGKLHWAFIYYVWPIMSMCVLPTAALRLLQLRTNLRKRLVFPKIEIIVDIAGYTTHMLAGVICYTERSHKSSAYFNGLWLFSVSTAILYALDGWLLMDTLAELRVSRLVPKHTLRLVHFTNTRLWRETRAMYYLFSRLPVERAPSLQTKAIIEAPSLALVLYDARKVRVINPNFLLEEVPLEGVESVPPKPEEIDFSEKIAGTSRLSTKTTPSISSKKSAQQEPVKSHPGLSNATLTTVEKSDISATSEAKTTHFPLEEISRKDVKSAPPKPEEIEENIAGTSTRLPKKSAPSTSSKKSAQQAVVSPRSKSSITSVTTSEQTDTPASSETKTPHFPLKEIPEDTESAPPKPEKIEILENKAVQGTSTRLTRKSTSSITSKISTTEEPVKSESRTSSSSSIISVTTSEQTDTSDSEDHTDQQK